MWGKEQFWRLELFVRNWCFTAYSVVLMHEPGFLSRVGNEGCQQIPMGLDSVRLVGPQNWLDRKIFIIRINGRFGTIVET